MKVFLVQFTVFTLTFLTFNLVFSQVKMGETISFSGVIESIQKDFNFIVINEVRVFISSDTTIVNEDGDILKTDKLKSRLNAVIIASQTKEGFYAKRIILKKKK